MSLGLATAIWLVLTYLVCGIPFGKVVADKEHVDIRSVGSGNIGTTNVARTIGAPSAGITLALDAGKGFVCTLLAAPAISAMAAGVTAADLAPTAPLGWVVALVFMVAVAGHVFSPYLHFHGGKGIAVGFGAALGFAWPVALGLLLVFVVFAVPTRYVSLGSCAAAVSLPIWAFVFYHPSWQFLLALCLTSALVLWAHRSNLVKLAHGEERKFSFHHDDPAHKG